MSIMLPRGLTVAVELLLGVPSCVAAALRWPCAEVACAAVRKLSLLQLRWGGLRCCQKAALQLLPKSFYSEPAELVVYGAAVAAHDIFCIGAGMRRF